MPTDRPLCNYANPIQVQVEASQMPSQLLVRDTKPAEPGCYDIHALRRFEGCDRPAVLGQHHRDHLDFSHLHPDGTYDIRTMKLMNFW